ncbi:DHA2 family efflux MFS transporter permease subunit [Consotaella salsifontis]|uniref:MFS transporter, DHA2 family, multidrug resistance protein n=1 Tax=Consotaella salsifontis TaxID=1365950 RepID=A0A1T4RKK1_9HYPH|nr:DHA2 family efflux MFS transporter permease subunit [Consotaella salsifontis]SKA16427.1 MFS transporter, DHA2 family, multidrug resistance protein [Consotaella salsifontis]
MSAVADQGAGSTSPEEGRDKASGAAWIAVAAGTIGALMATLDISIVNAALPTIQGEIGATGSEGTWISTAYLVAEIIMIPLSGWFERVLTLRNFLLIVTVAFAAFSVLCGISNSLDMMIIGRVGQGFTGGAMIPTALTIVSTRLPPDRRPIGVALFGLTAVLGPVLGPLIGGYLTERLSWHYAFFLNVPIAGGLVVLLLFGLETQKARLRDFLNADWIGIVGLALFLGCLTVVLEDGQREQWFESQLIIVLAAVSAVGLALLVIGQLSADEPVIDLGILFQRGFGSVFLLSLVTGAALYGILYLIPQFLAQIPDYNAYQSGTIALISGVPTLMIMPLFPFLVKTLDVRIAIGFGLLIYAVSCYIDTSLTAQSAGSDFYVSQMLRGVGQAFALLFLNQAATSAVPSEQAGDASGLFNAARNLGGSFGLAMISILQEQRSSFHFKRIAETVDVNSVLVQERLAQMTGGDSHAMGAALRTLFMTFQQQALVMTFNDIYFVFALILAASVPLVLLLRPLPKDQGGLSVH